MSVDEEKVIACAETLRYLSNEIRQAGNMGVVIMDEWGVHQDLPLSDHLWLIALLLDGRTDSSPTASSQISFVEVLAKALRSEFGFLSGDDDAWRQAAEGILRKIGESR